MPKDFKRRDGHSQSVKLAKQRATDPEKSVPELAAAKLSTVQSFDTISAADDHSEIRDVMKKKDKQALKHEVFMKRLEMSRSPYSKSHERRLKRKTREQVASGLADIQLALDEVETEMPPAVRKTIADGDNDSNEVSKPGRPDSGQIGESKNAPLSNSQRKRALHAERIRVPMILSNPEFTSNPFSTIRKHAQNTLIRHEKPAKA